MNIFVRYFHHMPKVFQPSCQNEVLADNVSANHSCIQICMCHMLRTVHFLKMCHLFTLHVYYLSVMSGGGGDSGGVAVDELTAV